MSISFIVSAYDRPEMLRCCLASLRAQTLKDIQIIVADNSLDLEIVKAHKKVCRQFSVRYIRTKALSCYHSAEAVMKFAEKEFVCFPSDDSYYVPVFAEKMFHVAKYNKWDLIYCDIIYELHRLALVGGYGVLKVEPRWTRIDKTGFLLRRSMFTEFPYKGMNGLVPAPCETGGGADGYLIEQLVAEGIRHGKVDEILVVHN